MFLKKSCIFILALLLCAVLTTACGGQNADKQQDGNNNNNSDTSGADSGTPGGDTTGDYVSDEPDNVQIEGNHSSYALYDNIMGERDHWGSDTGHLVFLIKNAGGQFVYIDPTGKEIFHFKQYTSTYGYRTESSVSGSDATVAVSLLDMKTRKRPLYVILNPSGDVVWKSDKTVVDIDGLGDGYYCIEREISTFDEHYKFAEIIDQHGESLFSTENYKQVLNITYLGEDMFTYQSPDATPTLYSAEKRAFLPGQCSSQEAADWAAQYGIQFNSKFRDGGAVLSYNNNGVLWGDKDGGIHVFQLEEGFSDMHYYFGESSFVITGKYMGEKCVGLFDCSTSSLTWCEADYLDRLQSASPLSCGRVVVYLKGVDGNGYFSIFDKDWNEILGPTPGNRVQYKAEFKNNRLYVYDENFNLVAYDTDGNEEVRLAEKGYKVKETYSFGFLVLDRYEQYFLIDENGETLYTKVDNSHSIDITEKLATLVEQ